MSTFRSIESITNSLVKMFEQPGLTVTARSPDKARDEVTGNQLNVFLYNTTINAAWRNQDLPVPTGKGQPRRPLLPLNLYYLITAYSSDEKSDLFAHEFLGRAMLTLHDKPEVPLNDSSQNAGIKNQPDPIRVTLHPLSLDEISKLWSVFQTPYRPSVAYEVGVVLIESEISEASPMPVTRRGEEGTGWDASSRFPAVLTSVRFKRPTQPGMRLNEPVSLVGQNLNAAGEILVSFQHPQLDDAFLLKPKSVSDTEVTVTIPDQPDKWPAGVYGVSLNHTIGNDLDKRTYASNVYPVALLPQIDVPAGGLKAVQIADPRFDRELSLPCRPKLRAKQSVELIIGSTVIEHVDITIPSKPVAKWKKSAVKFPPADACYARLRVNGVDSLVYDPDNVSQGFASRFIVQGLQ